MSFFELKNLSILFIYTAYVTKHIQIQIVVRLYDKRRKRKNIDTITYERGGQEIIVVVVVFFLVFFFFANFKCKKTRKTSLICSMVTRSALDRNEKKQKEKRRSAVSVEIVFFVRIFLDTTNEAVLQVVFSFFVSHFHCFLSPKYNRLCVFLFYSFVSL